MRYLGNFGYNPLGGVGSESEWSPLKIPGVVAYFDFTKPELPVLNNGNIASLYDLKRVAIMEQTLATKQPLYTQDVNGVWCARIEPGKWLNLPNQILYDLPNGAEDSLYMSLRTRSLFTTGSGRTLSGNNGNYGINQRESVYQATHKDILAPAAYLGVDPLNPCIIGSEFTALNTVDLYHNGAFIISDTRQLKIQLTTLALGAANESGAGATCSADVYSVFFSDRTLAEEDRQKLEGYEAHRANYANLLPVDHPYKASPP